ncbi:C40 family peptidase [Actinomadura sp. DC4]|uniref:C40 family peptidase n=1 Tax=Actinomadura sp. DC4 TaxID=3055069 RepID=UPI0025B00D65|nr:C40 family peptidase [Actinomadura sp. DC4]MDN3353052.1 C40 family peptidase [Actinomadura sp. DC4]
MLHSYERYLARMRVQSAKAGRAVRFAYRQIGKPYQWGGAGPRTYDCSGLVMAAWRQAGLRLPHRADLQHRMIHRKVGLNHLRPGDLVFFSGDHHVGIYVGRRRFLHAPHTGARVQQGTLSGWRLRTFAGAARPGAPTYHSWPHWVRTLAGHADEHASHRPHGHVAVPEITWPDDAAAPPDIEPGDQDSDVYPEQPPVETPPAAEPERRPITLPIPLIAARHRGRHQPEPPPGDHGGPRPRPHWPRSSVQQQNDEQRFDRDFDGRGDDDGGDLGDAGDGLDLRSLLGDAP